MSGTKQAVKSAAKSGKLTAKAGMSKLGNKLGFPGIGTKEQRARLLKLQAEAAALQPDPESAPIAERLRKALAAVNDKSVDRDTRIGQADTVIKDEAARLKALKDSRSAAKEAAKPDKAALAAATAAQAELTALLDRANKTVSKGFDTVRLPAPHNKAALDNEAEALRREIGGGDPATVEGATTRRARLEAAIGAFGSRVATANNALASEQRYLDDPATTGAIAAAAQLIEQCNRSLGPAGPLAGPLALTASTLAMAAAAMPRDPASIRDLLRKMAEGRAKLQEDKAFLPGMQAAAQADAGRQAAQTRLAKLLNIHADNHALLKAENAPGMAAVQAEVTKLHAMADGVSGPFTPELDKALTSGAEAVGRLLSDSRARLDAVFEKRVETVRTAIKAADKLLDEQRGKHGDAPVLAADLKAVEAWLDSAASIVPRSGVPPVKLATADLDLVDAQVKQAADRLQSLAANAGALETYDKDLKTLEKTFDQRGFFGRQLDKITALAPLRQGAQGLLEQYDPDLCKTMGTDLARIVKAMPNTPADATLKALKAEREKADKRLNELTPLIAHLHQVEGQYGTLLQERAAWLPALNGMVQLPRSYGKTLEALDAAIKKRPPDQNALDKALGDAQAAHKALGDQTDAQRKAASWDDLKAAHDEGKAAKLTATAETAKLRPLKEDLGSAEIAVGAVRGDRNELAACKRTLALIEGQIKAGATEAALDRLRTDLSDRLHRLLQNPKGEANRKSGELPDVLATLDKAAATISSDVAAVKADLAAFTDDPALAATMAPAIPLLEAYAALWGSPVAELRRLTAPINDPAADDNARRKAREAALAARRAFTSRMQRHLLTAEALNSENGFKALRNSVVAAFDSLDRLDNTLATCI